MNGIHKWKADGVSREVRISPGLRSLLVNINCVFVRPGSAVTTSLSLSHSWIRDILDG